MALANLLIKIGADISELQVNASKATQTMEKASAKIDSIGSSIKSTLVGAFSIGAVVSFGQELLRMGDDIQKLADRTSLSTDEIQKLSFVADQTGASLDGMVGAVQNLQQRLGSGDKGAIKAIGELGINMKEFLKLDSYDQMIKLSQAIGQIEDPSKRARIESELFGKTWKDIGPAITANMKAIADQAPLIGVDTVKALDTAGDALGKFGLQIKVWAANSYNFFGKVFDEGSKQIYQFIADTYKGTALLLQLVAKIPGASKVFGDLTDNVKSLRDTSQYYTDAAKAMQYGIDHTGDAAKKAVPPIMQLGDGTVELTDAQKKAKAAAEAHAKSIAGLTQELSGAGAVKAAKDLLEALKGMPPLQNLTAEAQTKVNKTMGEALDVFKALGQEPPAAIRQVYQETFRLTDTLPLINKWKDGLAHSADGLLLIEPIAHKLAHETWPGMNAGIAEQIRLMKEAQQNTQTLGDTIKDSLIGSLKQVPQIIVNAFTGGGGIGGAIKAVGSAVGAGIGGSIGAYFGGPIGSAIGSALGSLAGPLIGKIGSLLGIGATEYEKRMKAAAEETKKLQDQLIASHGSMAQLVIDADLVGINIKAAFDWKDPDAFKKVVDDITNKTNLLNAAMQEYGFTWEDLGDKARGAKLSQLFDELYAKTDILRTAGIDYHTILERQADDYSKLVQAAIRTGTEIPASMQPVLQDLVDMGLLVDENGQAFKDLSQVTWAKTLTQGFDEVTDAINKLADALLHGVGGAMDTISNKHVKVKVDYDTSGAPNSEAPEYATGTRGQFVDFGAGQDVRLHGREAVVTEGESLGLGSGNIYVSIGNRAIDDHFVTVTRGDAKRGGLRTRSSAGRGF